jgi:hypothetical protein
MKYHILYVSNCTPIRRSFKSKKELEEFKRKLDLKWSKRNLTLNDGYWVDLIFQGKVLYEGE